MNCLFVHIPKTGGTSIVEALNLKFWDLKGNTEVKNYTIRHNRFCNLQEEIDSLGSFLKFTFVRNPYDRAISLYEYGKKRRRINKEVSFLDFCLNIDSYYWLIKTPQVYWNDEFDFIGRFETLEEDVKMLAKRIGIKNCTLPHLLKSERKEVYYCKKSKPIIAEYFKKDFETFNYDF
jgi:hypothetical protein